MSPAASRAARAKPALVSVVSTAPPQMTKGLEYSDVGHWITPVAMYWSQIASTSLVARGLIQYGQDAIGGLSGAPKPWRGVESRSQSRWRTWENTSENSATVSLGSCDDHRDPGDRQECRACESVSHSQRKAMRWSASTRSSKARGKALWSEDEGGASGQSRRGNGMVACR